MIQIFQQDQHLVLNYCKLTSNDTVSFTFLEMITSHLPNRVAKNWNRFDKYLELFTAFALYTPDEAL